MDYAALLQMIMSAAGGAAANGAGAVDRDEARRIMNLMLQKYGAIKTPELQDVGAEELGPSALEGISEDPRFKEAQYGSLDALKGMQDAGGLTLEDTTALNKVQNQLARRESAGRASIANDFASRGQLGSAAQLAMAMGNQQDSANRAADAGADTAAAAQRRYFDSVLQRGRLGGEMSDRDYSRKASAAKARDVISAHNAAARTDKQANYLGNEASRQSEQTGRAWDAGLRGISTLQPQKQKASADTGYSAPPLVDAPDDDEFGNPYGGY